MRTLIHSTITLWFRTLSQYILTQLWLIIVTVYTSHNKITIHHHVLCYGDDINDARSLAANSFRSIRLRLLKGEDAQEIFIHNLAWIGTEYEKKKLKNSRQHTGLGSNPPARIRNICCTVASCWQRTCDIACVYSNRFWMRSVSKERRKMNILVNQSYSCLLNEVVISYIISIFTNYRIMNNRVL
jgi:hypothetical protein